MKTSTKWLFIGFLIIGIIGPILHFVYDWTGLVWTGVFAPVNESPWEHLKLTFWPAMLVLAFEIRYVYNKEESNNFYLAKTIGILLMPVVILAIFYSYTTILGIDSLAIDIGSFYIAILVGQLVTYKIYNMGPVSTRLNLYSAVALLGFALILIVFTFYPPAIPLFYDSESGGYGILATI